MYILHRSWDLNISLLLKCIVLYIINIYTWLLRYYNIYWGFLKFGVCTPNLNCLISIVNHYFWGTSIYGHPQSGDLAKKGEFNETIYTWGTVHMNILYIYIYSYKSRYVYIYIQYIYIYIHTWYVYIYICIYTYLYIYIHIYYVMVYLTKILENRYKYECIDNSIESCKGYSL